MKRMAIIHVIAFLAAAGFLFAGCRGIESSGNHLDKYVNGSYTGTIWRFDHDPQGVACTADGKKVWVIDDNATLHQGDENGNFSVLDTYYYGADAVALSADGSLGYVAAGTQSGDSLCKYVNGQYAGHIWDFDEPVTGVACTADGKKVWVVTGNTGHQDTYMLKQGDDNGNFVTIDTFDDIPAGVALSADGSLGYVVTKGKNVDKYQNGLYVGHIWQFDDAPSGVACTADGQTVWVVTNNNDSAVHRTRYLHQGDADGNFSVIDSYGDDVEGVALSADGSLGYVVTY